MATISLLKGTTGGKAEAALYGKKVKTVYQLVDITDVQTANAATLILGDIIKVLRIPAGTKVIDAGAKVIEAVDCASFHFGVGNSLTGGSFVYVLPTVGNGLTTGYPAEAYAGTYWPSTGTGAVSTFQVPVLADPRGQRFTAEGDIRIYVGSYTGSYMTTGIIGVYAITAPISPFEGANIDSTSQAGVPQS